MWKSNEENLCLICDVGSATVSAGLFLFSKKDKPKILYTTSVPIVISEKPNQDNLESLMTDFLHQAIVTISTEGLTAIHAKGTKEEKVTSAFVVFSSPWYCAKSSSVSIQNDSEFILSEELISGSIIAEEKKFENEALSGIYKLLQNKDIRMIEREMLKVLLNGYETKNPYEKNAKQADISLYMSLVREDILVKTEKVIRELLHTESIKFHTFPLVFFSTIRKLFPVSHNYILIDAAGESMDFSLIRNGCIERSLSFPQGRNFIYRSIMNDLSVGQDIAQSYLHLFQTKNADQVLEKQIDMSLAKAGDEIKQHISRALSDLGSTSTLPTSCFVVSDTEVSALFQNWIKDGGITSGVSKVIELTTSILSEKISIDKFVEADQFLMIEALYLHESKDFA